MTGVVDTTFDDKVRQHATTEMQVTAAQMQKQYEEIRRELDVLNKQRRYPQRIEPGTGCPAEQVLVLTRHGDRLPQISPHRPARKANHCRALNGKILGRAMGFVDWYRSL